MDLRVRVPLLLLAGLGSVVVPHTTHAQQAVKENLGKDCRVAQAEFSALPPEQQAGLFEYLTRVIALNTEAPQLPGAFVPPGGKPGGADTSIIPGQSKSFELGQIPALQALNAQRDLEEKRCALTLLHGAGGSALPALPGLARVYTTQELSDEIGVQLEEVVADIAEGAHLTGHSLPAAELDTIIQSLKSANNTVPRAILGEFSEQAIPLVINRLFADIGDQAALQAYARFLAEADPLGARSLRAFIDTTPQQPIEASITIFPLLPSPPPDIATPFLDEFVRWAIDPARTRLGQLALTRRCSLSPPPKFNAEGVKLLEAHPELFLSADLSGESAACLVRAVPSVSEGLPKLLTSANDEQATKVLLLLQVGLKSLSSAGKDALFVALKERAFAPDPAIAAQAIEHLGLFTDRRAELLRTFFQILKGIEKGKEQDSTVIQATLFKVAATLSPGEDTARFTPYLVAEVQGNRWSPGATALAAVTPDTQSAFVKLLSAQLPLTQTRRIVEVFAKQQSLSKKVVPALIELLARVEVSLEVEQALYHTGKDSMAALRAHIKKLSCKECTQATHLLTRVALLAVLAKIGGASPGELTDLLKALAAEGCGQLRGRAEIVLPLVMREDLDPTLRDSVVQRIRACIPQVDLATARAFITQAPRIAIPPLEKTLAFFSPSEGSPELASLLLEEAVAQKLSEIERRSILHAALATRRRPWQALILEHLLPSDREDSTIGATLRDLARSSRDDPALQILTLKGLASLGDTEFDWRGFIRKTMQRAADGEAVSQELEVIRALPPEITEQELLAALASEKGEKILGACRVAPALGSNAAPLIGQLWVLKQRREPALRYGATLALLSLNPLAPELGALLKEILVNRYFTDAQHARIPWPNTVAAIELQKEQLGSLRKARLEWLRTRSSLPG